jgi:hypothetical protein
LNTVKKLIPHLCIVLSGMFITFIVIDQFNSAMSVVGNNSIEKTFLFLFSIVSLIVSIMLISRQRREDG